MGREDLKDDPRFATPKLRVQNAAVVDKLVGDWCAQYTKKDAMETLQNAGVPAGAVFDTQELLNDPHLRQRGMFEEIEHPTRGKFHIPGWPVKMSESRVPVKTAPLLGQHTAELLSEWLGMSESEIQEYIKETPLKKGTRD
jgi:formyl-CoA transferase